MKKVVVQIICIIIAIAVVAALSKFYYRQICKDALPTENTNYKNAKL